MALIALKVDVDTLRGTREGVPRLLKLLQRYEASATFLFSVGPDHTGWALKRLFRPGFLSKISRTSVLKHYGLRTLLQGVLLPAPDIGLRASDALLACAAQGHECGLHAWDHVLWQDRVRDQSPTWTRHQMTLAHLRFADLFGHPPSTYGAAGWQANATAWRLLDTWELRYASDGRGAAPYRPMVDGELLRHVQLPTTLPTFDELIGLDGVSEHDVDRAVLRLTAGDTPQVFTLHAELEGGALLPAFERLLQGWRAQGHRWGTLKDLHDQLDLDALPRLPLTWGTVPGRSGELIVAPARN